MRRGLNPFTFIPKIIFIFFITVGLSEGLLRLYNKVNPTFIFPTSSYNRFRSKPFAEYYHFRSNSKGFYDREYTVKKNPSTYRILGIGDSFVAGIVPYPYNFLVRLEEKLNQETHSGFFEIINMGIHGMGVDSYSALLVNEGLELHPDMVLCCFFIGNDFRERREGDQSYYVISFLKYLFNILPNYKGKELARMQTYHDDAPTFTTKTFLRIETKRSRIYLGNGDFLRQLDYVTLYLRQMRDICRQKNIQFLVVIIPDELQVNTTLQSAILKNSSFPPGAFNFRRPNQLLRHELELLGIPYLDLLDDFEKATLSKRQYKHNNTHWNIAGNEFAANLIFKKLEKMGILQHSHHDRVNNFIPQQQ